MQNPRLAGRYAKSLLDLSVEQGKLDTIYNDMLGLQHICDSSAEFVSMIKSPIVKGDKKQAIVKAVTSGQVNSLTEAFINLVISKGREFYLPEIATSFISLYKEKNKINDVVLTTAQPMDDSLKATLQSKIQQQFQGMTIDLTTKVNEKLIGGFVLEANNNLFDASILRDLNDIKKQFLKNEYVPDLR